ncbi:MAG TPA: hypothetical protein VGB73_18335 [Pyrinomonadaceae bacterium]|jgi:hypothetical protein
MQTELEEAFETLSAWCRARDYAGHDPFDALNSPLFQSTPLRRSRLARLAWTQAFKRSPFNLRRLVGVPAERNAKGTALFALAALARHRTLRKPGTEDEARALLDALLEARLELPGGANAWGYNFDWQGRAFYAPRGTPTVVPTAFAVRALAEASRLFREKKSSVMQTSSAEDSTGAEGSTGGASVSYLDAARRACRFILEELNRTDETTDEVCFSYTPLDRTRVFNASLLAGETLATVGELTGETDLCEWGLRAARYVARRQRADGSWAYGADSYQSWSDNFHTAFILTSLSRILKATGDADQELTSSLRRGYAFWRERFFLADGWPKYYHSSAYPADTHSAAASIVAFVELRDTDEGALAQALTVARWTLREMRDPRRGFFYYQRRRFQIVRTPYMRWSQAWMLYALARLLEMMNAAV